MSTPPPGTPPTPQPPPTDPQYPPPTQYPPQYPPQQPYYAQPAPPPRESNTVLIIVLVVVIIVVVLAVLAWWVVTALLSPTQSFTRVTVTDTSWTISGDTTDFVGSNLACGSHCPQTVTIGTIMTFQVTLRNTDALSSHNVTSITVGQPFTLSSVSPTLPHTVPSSSSVMFTITVDASTIGGNYVLSGVINTS